VTIFLGIFFQKVTLTMLLGTFSSFFFGSKMPISHHKKSMLWDFIFSLLWKVLE
jgi:hypothetical protein